MNLINEQYFLIQSSRAVLFQYCATVSQKHFIEPVHAFGNKSMCGALTHVAKTYFFWIGEFGLNHSTHPASAEPLSTLTEIRRLYSQVDILIFEFISGVEGSWESPITGSVNQNRNEVTVSALQLFTHVTTHEFHHKGQILSMSRLLGYTPVDTDIIRF